MTPECRRKQQTAAGYVLFLFASSQITSFVSARGAAATAAASSFPAPLPEYSSQGRLARHKRNWNDGGGGASSDDEGGEEDGMSSSEEFQDHPEEQENSLLWFDYPQNASVIDTNALESNSIKLQKKERDKAQASFVTSPLKASPSRPKNELEQDSPPLQTIHKLRQMLDDTDYITKAPSSRKRETCSNDKNRNIIPTEETSIQPRTLTKNSIANPLKALEVANDPTSPPGLSAESSETDAKQETVNSAGTHFKSQTPPPSVEPDDRLWTSRDRSKYKKVQKRSRRASTPLYLTSDDEASDSENGPEYVLPNVPVYFSDGEETEEGDSDAEDDVEEHKRQVSPPTQGQRIPPPVDTNSHAFEPSSALHTGYQSTHPPPQGYTPPLHIPPRTMYPYYGGDPQSTQQGSFMRPYNPYIYGYPYTPYQPPYGPYQPHQQHQYAHPNPYPQQWTSGGYTVPQQHQINSQLGAPTNPLTQQSNAQTIPRPIQVRTSASSHTSTYPKSTQETFTRVPFHGVKFSSSPFAVDGNTAYPRTMIPGPSLAEAGTKISFDAIQKIGLMLVSVALACYAGVSPRSLPLTEYNLKFYENFQLVSLAFISPAIKFLSVFDARENDVNDAVNTFFASFSLGYPMAFMLQVVATTFIRLAVFAWFEPRIFSLAPKVPLLVIPWTLRENRYRPKRITLLAADFCASCVASPIIEEYVKLKTLQWTTNLRKNFCWVKKANSSRSSRRSQRRWVAEPVSRNLGETDVITANQYVTQMLAASIGFKLCDTGRRILMYTKATDANKSFYAFCRGLFPIHELCGTMTAIELARRDLLGVNVPLWRLLLPAALFHGMANMRGKKPVFRWGSSTPWSEMQLSPLHILDASTLPKLLSKGFAKLMWLVLLGRVLGYCIKNYYLVNRRAVKRTTRYAGNPAAFTAEMATADMLKKK